MKILSSSFKDGEILDAKYAMKAIAGGKNISPNIKISNIPDGTESIAIAFVDRHPVAGNWVHWLAINIPAKTTDLPEDASQKNMPAGSVKLSNSFGFKGYGGPQPPAGTGIHNYELAVYALSAEISLPKEELTEREFLEIINGKILESDKITAGFENR